MHYINPTAGELFYLRYLLLHVPNPTSFEDLLIVDDNAHPIFHAACTARGLLLHDSMPDDTLRECSAWHGGKLLRGLYVYLLLYSDIDNALNLWNNYKTSLSDDCIYKLQHEYTSFTLPNDAPGQQAIAEDFCLHLIQIRLEENNTSTTKDVSLNAFGLPAVQQEYE